MARDIKLYYKLEEQIKDDFQKLAEEHGTTMSGMTAHIIGQYVYTQKKSIEKLAQVVEDALGKELQRLDEEKRAMDNKLDRILTLLEDRKTVSVADLDTE